MKQQNQNIKLSNVCSICSFWDNLNCLKVDKETELLFFTQICPCIDQSQIWISLVQFIYQILYYS